MFDVGETAWVEAVPSVVMSDEHVELEPEYH
jgi:hypothetical protein